LPSTTSFEAQVESGDRLRIEEAVIRFAEVVLSTISGHRGAKNSPGARDERRISQVLRYVEEHIGEVVTLDGLSSVAAMSKYHFLRTFRRLVGVTPYQYLLGARMRAVATQLVRSGEPISSIALEAGFGDLSTFNRRFRDQFGVSPRIYRRQLGRRRSGYS